MVDAGAYCPIEINEVGVRQHCSCFAILVGILVYGQPKLKNNFLKSSIDNNFRLSLPR